MNSMKTNFEKAPNHLSAANHLDCRHLIYNDMMIPELVNSSTFKECMGLAWRQSYQFFVLNYLRW